MSAIEYHYQTMGRILSHLIGLGLKRTDLNESDAMEIMTERRGDEEEVLETFADVLHWMNNEGLIHVSSIQEYDGGYSFHGIQLSSKGISVIRSKPTNDQTGETVQETLTKSAGKNLDDSVYTKIGEFVGGIAGGFTKSIGSG